MTMYERIKDLRIKKGLSQQELARLTGYQDRSSIAKIESGVVDLPQSKILLFAKVLDISPAKLMGFDENTPADLVEDVLTAPEPMKEALVNQYGLDPSKFRSQHGAVAVLLSSHEHKMLLSYREHPELQAAVDRVLLLEPEQVVQPMQA